MIAVLGIEVNIDSTSNENIAIDAFDYHLYQGLKIEARTKTCLNKMISALNLLTNKLLSNNHLSRSQVKLAICGTKINSDIQPFAELFSATNNYESLSDALSDCVCGDIEQAKPTLIVSLDYSCFNACAAILVTPQVTLKDINSPLSQCHCYGYINAQSVANNESSKTSQRDLIEQHLEEFMVHSDLDPEQLESIIINQAISSISTIDHAQTYLAFSDKKLQHSPSNKRTLLTSIDCYDSQDEQFMALLSLISSVLCVDQQYRLGCRGRLLLAEPTGSRTGMWRNSPYYLLPESTSYLTQSQNQTRQLLLSFAAKSSHQLILVSNLDIINNKQVTPSYNNGFLAQQQMKPFVFKGTSVQHFIEMLRCCEQSILQEEQSFKGFSEKHYKASQYNYLNLQSNQKSHYCLVLLADCFEQLSAEITLAVNGLPAALNNNQVWKTPRGSYFSGQLVEEIKPKKPLSFVYPGVGALYVNMGKDLLRLFPHSHHALTQMSPDLAQSLQDQLITPRHLSVDREQQLQDQKNLRHNLANIAEAGVSYAYLLTHIFQCGLSLNATSAAGYSMGEVSMFAALGCWENPHLLSQRLRHSPIFNDQLAGPLKRLETAWGETNGGNSHDWESFHIKAGLVQVKAIISDYPRVYITIRNTADSLVIAGEPKQCLALAEELGVRAIALNVNNIIHCELSQTEYQRMQLMYSLPVQQKLACQLFSTSCYLPVPITEKAIAVSISKCLTEFVDFPRLIKNMYATGERVFIEMGAGKSLSTWIERILKNNQRAVTCLSVNQKNFDDYTAILKTVAALVSLGYPVNLQPFFNGTLVRSVEKIAEPVLVS
ncbi:PfaB family protein [Psychromonas arctica]|uniref:PfaB family protein n=1 Tax=Psychromonas arctica TaxID=168275 RepID=UPI002FCF9B1C